MNAFKSFKNFNEAIQEVLEISETILHIIGHEEEFTEEGVIKKLLVDFNNRIPTVTSELYPNTAAISVSATEVGYKLPGHIAFGWRVKMDKDEISYDFRITVNTSSYFAKDSIIIREAKARGWKIVDKKKRYNNKYNPKNPTVVIQEEKDSE